MRKAEKLTRVSHSYAELIQQGASGSLGFFLSARSFPLSTFTGTLCALERETGGSRQT